jgi:tetrahydromethanopterin S-methyltransferase subunit G
MDERFDRVESEIDQRFSRVEGEMDRRFGHVESEMSQRFGHVDKDIRELRTDMNALQRTMIQVGGGLIAANLTLMAAVIGLMVTQL